MSLDQLREEIANFTIGIKKIHHWIKKSGFPDDWPLTVSKEETIRMLKKGSFAVDGIVKLYGGWGLTEEQVATMLTGRYIQNFFGICFN